MLEHELDAKNTTEMAAFPVISSLNLSSLSTSPSPTCLQWSGDGQAILLTQNAVYILVS